MNTTHHRGACRRTAPAPVRGGGSLARRAEVVDTTSTRARDAVPPPRAAAAPGRKSARGPGISNQYRNTQQAQPGMRDRGPSTYRPCAAPRADTSSRHRATAAGPN